MAIIRGLELGFGAADTATFSALELKPTFSGLTTAVNYGDTLGAAQAGLDHLKGWATGANYAATGINGGTTGAVELAKYLHFAIDTKIVDLLSGLTITQAIAGLGTVISGLAIAASSILIHRDTKLLVEIPPEKELKDNAKLSKTVDDLSKLNYNHFYKTLPDYLKAKVDSYGGEKVFENLKYEIEVGNDYVVKELITEIKDHVNRNRVLHILTLVGAVITLIGSIGVFLAFPPSILLAFTIMGIIVTVTCVAIKKGWVENPKEGFNWKLLLPEFIQKKLKGVEETEMVQSVDGTLGMYPKEGLSVDSFETRMEKSHGLKLEDVTNARTGIATLPRFIANNVTSVTKEDVADFTRALEPEKKPSFWKKLKTKFSKKKKEAELPESKPKLEPEKPVTLTASQLKHPLQDSIPIFDSRGLVASWEPDPNS
jgi:hypothetical protein